MRQMYGEAEYLYKRRAKNIRIQHFKFKALTIPAPDMSFEGAANL